MFNNVANSSNEIIYQQCEGQNTVLKKKRAGAIKLGFSFTTIPNKIKVRSKIVFCDNEAIGAI